MKENEDELAQRTQALMDRVQVAIDQAYENLRRVDQKLARVAMDKNSVDARIGALPAPVQEHIRALGDKFAQRSVASSEKQLAVAQREAPLVAASRLPKGPRNMI